MGRVRIFRLRVPQDLRRLEEYLINRGLEKYSPEEVLGDEVEGEDEDEDEDEGEGPFTRSNPFGEDD